MCDKGVVVGLSKVCAAGPLDHSWLDHDTKSIQLEHRVDFDPAYKSCFSPSYFIPFPPSHPIWFVPRLLADYKISKWLIRRTILISSTPSVVTSPKVMIPPSPPV